MFGMWRGLTGLSTCLCLLMLIYFSPPAGKKCDFPIPPYYYQENHTEGGMLQHFEGDEAHLV